MGIRKLAVTAAIAGLVALAGGASSAAATTALRTDPGGALLTGATTLRATSGSYTGGIASFGTNACTDVSLDADVSRNSSATSITGTLTALTFTSCSGKLGLVTFEGCQLDRDVPLPTIHINAGAGGGTVTINNLTVRCSMMNASGFCYYTASVAVGSFANAPSTLTFNNVTFTSTPGTTSVGSVCGTSGLWNMGFTHIVQGGTNRTVTVTTT